jgi:hypothetical protein
MSVTERLQAMDQFWDSLNRCGDEIPSPDWHQEVLAERKARAQLGEAKFLIWPNSDRVLLTGQIIAALRPGQHHARKVRID